MGGFEHFRSLGFLILGILIGRGLVESCGGDLFGVIFGCGFVLVGCVGALLFCKNGLYGSLFLHTAVIAFGAMAYGLENGGGEVGMPESSFVYKGVVVSPVAETRRSFSCDLLVTSAGSHRMVKAYFEKSVRAGGLGIGDCVECFSRWEAPHDFFITPRFNYKDYLWQHGFCGTTYVRENGWRRCVAEDLAAQGLTFLERTRISALKLRERLLENFRSGDVKDENYGLLAAMTLGDKSRLSSTLRADYASAGAAHVLALSGLHLSIILGILSMLLFFLGRRWKGLVELLFVWTFVFVSGMPVSILRVALMFSIMILANVLDRKSRPVNTLSLAAIVILVFSPRALFDVSFQLSFAAMLSIYLLFGRLLRVFPRRLRNVPPLRWLLSLLCLTFSAQLGTLPITLYHFGQFPIYSLITNSFVGLFATAVLGLTALVILLDSLAAIPLLTALSFLLEIKKTILIALDNVLQAMSQSVAAIAGLPHSTVSDFYINLPQVFFAYALISLVCLPLFRKEKRTDYWRDFSIPE